MAAVPRVLAHALPHRDVAVTLKNGVVVRGRAVELEAETGSVVLDVQSAVVSAADATPVPHLMCVPRATLRGSSIAFIDFLASQVRLDDVAKATLAL
jgi:small nuclear ribonucleoprotein (snRNP)-like protein